MAQSLGESYAQLQRRSDACVDLVTKSVTSMKTEEKTPDALLTDREKRILSGKDRKKLADIRRRREPRKLNLREQQMQQGESVRQVQQGSPGYVSPALVFDFYHQKLKRYGS